MIRTVYIVPTRQVFINFCLNECNIIYLLLTNNILPSKDSWFLVQVSFFVWYMALKMLQFLNILIRM